MTLYTVITHSGPREYLRYRNFIFDGELEIVPEHRGRRLVTIADIQEAVAAYSGIPLAEMTSDRRTREVARPRQVAMYLAKHLTPKSLPEIGRRFGGRDHTTVIHAVRTINRLREIDRELDSDVLTLERDLAA